MDQGVGARPLSEAEQRLLEQREQWRQAEGGYGHIQGTKPQTLSYGLNDSPAGLAAWIVEKYRSWSVTHVCRFGFGRAQGQVP